MFSNPNLKDPEYKGELVDCNLKNGPVEERKSTDFGFLVTFIIFVAMYSVLAVYVGLKGDLNKAS